MRRQEADGLLDNGPPPLSRAQLDERHAQLERAGYVPPVSAAVEGIAASASHRQEWWENHWVTAEYTTEARGQIAQMPDDYTPSETGGRAHSGLRRTHRMRYRGAGVDMRMPSATSIRRWDKEHGGTFDVPVAAAYPGGTVQGWVRVTRNGDTWHATGLGFPDGADAHVAEAVSAVLEARRVTRALPEVGDLIDRRRARAEIAGAELEPVRSRWIKGMGYEPATGTMVMQTETGKAYGYAVDRDLYRKVAGSPSPGAAYNKLIKSGYGVEGTAVERCEKCGRFTAGAHACPGAHNDPTPGVRFAQNEAARQHAAAVTTPRREPSPPPPPMPPRVDPTPAPPAPTQLVDPHADTIDLKKILHDQGRQPMRTVGEKQLYGRRGWTTDVSDTIGTFTSSAHVPHAYFRDDDGELVYSNGDMGLVYYAGVSDASASELLRRIPPKALDGRQNDGPRLRSILTATRDNPDVSFGGYVVGPDRTDERVSADTVFVKAETQADAIRAVSAIDPEAAAPDELTAVDMPGQPGVKAWRAWWD